MALISKTDVKNQLGYSDKYDSQIDAIIPGAVKKAFKASQNYHHISDQYVESYQISFDSAQKKISLSGGGFLTTGLNPIRFSAGMYIHIENSVLNNGIKFLATVSNTELTLDASEVLYDEDVGSLVKISLMNIDDGFKSAIVEFVGYKLSTGKKKGVNSEKLDDYSANYRSEQEALVQIFSGYKKIVSSN